MASGNFIVNYLAIMNKSEALTHLDPSSVSYQRCTVDLSSATINIETIQCENLEDVLGGFARAYKILGNESISDPYSPENPLIVSTGLLTGTPVMTGLRTYFSSYSPLKVSNQGLPGVMWSAASGKFGTKLRWTGIDEIVFTGLSDEAVVLHVQQTESGPNIQLIPAGHLLGKSSHDKIVELKADYPDCHFAMIGPAGENYENCFYGAVGCSTENLLKSGDDKCRWAGRAGMGSVMGSKNLLGIIADSRDIKEKLSTELKEWNKYISSGPGSRKYREPKKGGLGGTWSNYVPMEKLHIVPENNFRPKATGNPEQLFREKVEEEFIVKAENCFRCAIACHKNIYEKDADGGRGKFLAKFDYEPLNLLSTNLGIHDGGQAAELVGLCDRYGMDSISLGATLSYALDYNERNPDKPILNNIQFGDFEAIRQLVIDTGSGQCGTIGQGSKRLSEECGQPGYAMQVKGLELPAYLPETNPGYIWAIAGGHMSMQTYSILAADGDTSMEYWVEKIVDKGLYMVRDDLTGICKFANVDNMTLIEIIEHLTGLKITEDELKTAVRNSFLRGLWLEKKQGFSDSDYTLPTDIFDNPNNKIKTELFVTSEYQKQLKQKVFDRFNEEIEELCA